MRVPLAAAAVVAAMGIVASGQSPGGNALLVTSDGGLHLQAWKKGPAGFAPVWEATPRAADGDFAKRRQEVVPVGRDGSMVLADCDGDGRDELVVMDGLGITVYGSSPAYYPFETAGSGALAVGDVDGDGRVEFVTQRGTEKGRDLEIWKPSGTALTSLWRQEFEGFGNVLLWQDVNGDGRGELVTSGEGALQVLEKGEGSTWSAVAEIPTGASVVAVRTADVDGDGKRELLVLTSQGKLTAYKHRKVRGRDTYGVFWQSPYLITPGLRPQGGSPPVAYPGALAAGDVDGDGQDEALVGMSEMGLLPNEDKPAGARLRVFDFDGQRDLAVRWTSGPPGPLTGGGWSLAVGDLDGDGVAEWTAGGRDVQAFDKASNGFRSVGSPCPTCRDGVVGRIGELREPAGSTLIVPLYWNVRNAQLVAGKPTRVDLALYSPCAEARDVRVTVIGPEAELEIAGGVLQVPSIPARGVVNAPAFTLTGKGGQATPFLNIEITAAGGYRQTIPLRLYVSPAPPNFEAADVEGRISAAQAHAKDENRRVLVVWGGREDKASQAFLEGVLRDREVSRTLLYEYDVVRVDTGPAARKVAAKYHADLEKGGLPYLTILDASGKLLSNQPGAAFRKAEMFDAKAAQDFLVKHQAVYLNAETLFNEALSRAKKEQKTLFVWFSAPW
jgi:hypothetical protein